VEHDADGSEMTLDEEPIKVLSLHQPKSHQSTRQFQSSTHHHAIEQELNQDDRDIFDCYHDLDIDDQVLVELEMQASQLFNTNDQQLAITENSEDRLWDTVGSKNTQKEQQHQLESLYTAKRELENVLNEKKTLQVELMEKKGEVACARQKLVQVEKNNANLTNRLAALSMDWTVQSQREKQDMEKKVSDLRYSYDVAVRVMILPCCSNNVH
jgi:hypothetical protein